MTTTPEQITDLISGYTDLKDYFESCREDMQPFMAAVRHPHQVTLEVGADKEFAHPIEACLHLNHHAMANNIAWKIVIDPGIYPFPYQDHRGCTIDHGKQVEITSRSGNAADVVFEGHSEHHDWLVRAEHQCHLTISHITFRDARQLTRNRIDAVNQRNYVENNAGGIVHGVLVTNSSSLNIAHCQFSDLWHAIGLQVNSQATIDQCNGTAIGHAVFLWQTSFARMTRCQWTGVIDDDSNWHYGTGVGVSHSSVLHANGNRLKNFHHGVHCHWSSDAHFHRAHSWGGSDGRTPVDIVNGRIENCHHGVHVWHSSGGNFSNLSIINSRSHAFVTGCGSSTYAHHNVTIDGAHDGFYCRHSASIVANHAVVKNCRATAFVAAYLAEIHAGGTRAHVSGNAHNYSPGASHTPGNHGGQIYIS